MKNEREVFQKYLDGVVITNHREFIDILNAISPLIDGWGVANPISFRRLQQLSHPNIRAAAYKDFCIPKKSGGMRHISAPTGLLRLTQEAINIVLQNLFTPSQYATGFTIGKSIRNNAEIHKGQTCIHNIDLENFFPSITKDMLCKALRRELKERITSNPVINLISNLCTMPTNNGIEVLPQGAPTSPILSNIVLKSLDYEMNTFATKIGCRYSRYADDITFSHHNAIRRMAPSWTDEISRIIERHGFKINAAKTRTLVPGQRMEVTGVVVSEKINVPRAFIKHLRTLLHLWEKYGYEGAQQIYAAAFCHGTTKNLCNVIEGKVNYLRMIKGDADPTVQRYRRLSCLIQKFKTTSQCTKR